MQAVQILQPKGAPHPTPETGDEQKPGFRPPALRNDLLLQVLACCLPVTLFFLGGHAVAGGRAYFLVLLAFLGYYSLKKKPLECLCLIVGTLPVLVTIRGFFIPYVSLVVLLLGFSCFELFTTKEPQRFWTRKPLHWLLMGAFVYWWLSFLFTSDHSNNFRTLELSLSACAVFLLNWRRSYLATALLGMAMSTLLLAIGFFPYGDRLGMGSIDGVTIGNPINIGVPCALIFLLTMAEGGKRLLLHNRTILRIACSVGSGVILLLSTSRGSWLVAIVGVLLLAILDSSSRKPILKALLVLAAVAFLIAATPSGKSISHYFEKTTNSDNSLTARTDGRYEQWESFPRAFAMSPLWGFGPGSSRITSLRFSGENIIYHSLYLQIGIETGLLGLVLVFYLLGRIVSDAIAHRKVCGEVVPLLSILSFIFLAITVTGIDAFGGTLLGIGLIAGNVENMWLVRWRPLRRTRADRSAICAY